MVNTTTPVDVERERPSNLGVESGKTEEERWIADIRGTRPGPTLLITAGIHGNEPAGVTAAKNVVATLASLTPHLCGRLVVLSGNRTALARGERYIERDLNRSWYGPKLERLQQTSPELLEHEDREQLELLTAQQSVIQKSPGPVHFLDLHSTSGQSEPFVCFGDTLRNRKMALALPVTAILGLEEVIDGAMLGYWADRGYATIAFEGGQHQHPQTVACHIAVIWMCLVHAGMLLPTNVPDLAQHEARLVRARGSRPRVVEIIHRHLVNAEDDFEMLPGFSSFQPVRAGDILARDKRGPIPSPETGLLLMPRYQGQGEDGFFLARPVAPAWLKISEWLRAAPTQHVFRWLPGFVGQSNNPQQITFERTRVTQRTVDLMHLCGFRRRVLDARSITFSKRPADN